MKELAFTKITPEIEFTKELNEELKYQPKKFEKAKSEYLIKSSKFTNIFEEVELKNDWCISENGTWGVPIPYFIFKKKGMLNKNN